MYHEQDTPLSTDSHIPTEQRPPQPPSSTARFNNRLKIKYMTDEQIQEKLIMDALKQNLTLQQQALEKLKAAASQCEQVELARETGTSRKQLNIELNYAHGDFQEATSAFDVAEKHFKQIESRVGALPGNDIPTLTIKNKLLTSLMQHLIFIKSLVDFKQTLWGRLTGITDAIAQFEEDHQRKEGTKAGHLSQRGKR